MHRSFFFMVAMAGLLGTCSTGDGNNNLEASLSELPPPNLTQGLFAYSIPEPLYPLAAQRMNLEGWVMLNFNVTSDGSVVANSIDAIQAQPPGYFESAAIAAARGMRFENNRNETVQDVRWVFRFELENEELPEDDSGADDLQFRELIPMRYITPAYPESARAQGIEGYVVVNFTVTANGEVGNIEIIESEPPGVFDNEALAATARLRFEPRIVLNEAVAVDGVEYRFDWELP
jgi:TonB family protein